MHYYSQTDRAKHLQELIEALKAFIPALETSGQYADSLASYKDASLAAQQLVSHGFTQEDLSNLSRSIPRLFWLHKEWSPPFEPSEEEPVWFKQLEPLEAKVNSSAEQLRVIGEY